MMTNKQERRRRPLPAFFTQSTNKVYSISFRSNNNSKCWVLWDGKCNSDEMSNQPEAFEQPTKEK